MLLRSRLYLVIAILGTLALLTVACAQTTPTPEPSGSRGFEDTAWMLESYGEKGNLQTVIKGTEITAIFDSTKAQVHGSAGCNRYFGDHESSNNKLSILQIAYTEMYCLEPEGVMEQEQKYLKALQAAESYEIRDGKLRITCGAEVLIFVAKQE